MVWIPAFFVFFLRQFMKFGRCGTPIMLLWEMAFEFLLKNGSENPAETKNNNNIFFLFLHQNNYVLWVLIKRNGGEIRKISIFFGWKKKVPYLMFVLFRLHVAFNNLSVILGRCLDVAGSSMLTFRALSHWNIIHPPPPPPDTWHIPPSHIILTQIWSVLIPCSTFLMLSA